ncbi:hypothetical protein CZ797_13415 [Pseudoalteromonas sp. JB197]|nr:hypothetical protein CZ797_13415 [Pseudoalteromonas sp. JB197]
MTQHVSKPLNQSSCYIMLLVIFHGDFILAAGEYKLALK